MESSKWGAGLAPGSREFACPVWAQIESCRRTRATYSQVPGLAATRCSIELPTRPQPIAARGLRRRIVELPGALHSEPVRLPVRSTFAAVVAAAAFARQLLWRLRWHFLRWPAVPHSPLPHPLANHQ